VKGKVELEWNVDGGEGGQEEKEIRMELRRGTGKGVHTREGEEGLRKKIWYGGEEKREREK
jgi:hypothetical protein